MRSGNTGEAILIRLRIIRLWKTSECGRADRPALLSFCEFHGSASHVLTSSQSIRCTAGFHDADMLALAEVLLEHCNSALRHVRRLDFSKSSKQGKAFGKRGFSSHGALALSKVLKMSEHVEEVLVPNNKIGPYGAMAVFEAASENEKLRRLSMMGCRIGELGARAFAEVICRSKVTGLKEVDLRCNRLGLVGTTLVEKALFDRESTWTKEGDGLLYVDLDGNLVFQEVMNAVSHTIGFFLAIVGGLLLHYRVADKSSIHRISCTIYSSSLLIMYLFSTLFHSFVLLPKARSVFLILDHCGIYLLIAGTYTPYLLITYADESWAYRLAVSIWVCGFSGMIVEGFLQDWRFIREFSYVMYFGMIGTVTFYLPHAFKTMPIEAIRMIVFGIIAYASGVPFFLRDINMDHTVWHVFVVAGSFFHWLGLYSHIVLQF